MIVETLTCLTFPYLIINIADIHPPTHAFTRYYAHFSYYSFYICIHTYIQCRVDNPPKVHVFGLWKEAGVPRANLHRHRVNTLNSTQNGLWIKSKAFKLWDDSAEHCINKKKNTEK